MVANINVADVRRALKLKRSSSSTALIYFGAVKHGLFYSFFLPSNEGPSRCTYWQLLTFDTKLQSQYKKEEIVYKLLEMVFE